jgi:hypothetical protein
VKLTVWGEAGGPKAIAATYNRSGQLTEARTYRELGLELPAEGIELDADHNGARLGELVHAELGDDNRLRAVAVLDTDRLEQVEQPVFFSPLFEMRGRDINRSDTYIARAAQLLGLSLTLETARVGALPVSWRRGGLRDPADRYTWPSSWRHSDPLLAHALDYLGSDRQARTRSATRIVDQRERNLDNLSEAEKYVLLNEQADEIAAASWLHQPLRHRPGRILSVR